ncbi:hypothetical protein RJT34_04681 [Clitoria ternatea]|uniref:Uncharacterized protein n=1 Tax=Clitoria ternatea TaxID=43366 RepID=A0AAN9Q2W5_CLITE
MEYQSFGRAQRPKGANIKQALEVILALVVCAWLLYQINHSRNNTGNYDGSSSKIDGGYEAILLGRKGTLPQLDEISFPDSGNVDSVEGKDSSSGRDDVDESNGTKEDKAEEKIGLEPESQPKVSSKNEHRDLSKKESGNIGVESRKSESGHKEFGDEKHPKRPKINDSKSNCKGKEVQLREQVNDVQVRKNAKSDFSPKENAKSDLSEKGTRMQKNVVESGTDADMTEETDEVQSFHDENGVPPSVNETEIVFGQLHTLHEENMSDNTVEVNFEGSRNDASADEETNPGTTTHMDTSGIKRNSEIGVDSLVL